MLSSLGMPSDLTVATGQMYGSLVLGIDLQAPAGNKTRRPHHHATLKYGPATPPLAAFIVAFNIAQFSRVFYSSVSVTAAAAPCDANSSHPHGYKLNCRQIFTKNKS